MEEAQCTQESANVCILSTLQNSSSANPNQELLLQLLWTVMT